MGRRLTVLFGSVTLLCAALIGNAGATGNPPKESGLLITPLRQFLSVDAGQTLTSDFSVANLTSQPLQVDFSVQQFSVSDYVYNYKFEAPQNDWLHLGVTTATLQPNQTQTIPYSFVVPPGSTPGGHYYTLFASANLASEGVGSTIQAADLVYLTVNGRLSSVSHLENSSIPWVSFGSTIPFSLQPVNTGNVYSFVYVSGELHGLFVRPPQTSTAHILMPGHVRSLSGNIPSPVLPGIYKAVYGYKTESNWIVQQSHWVIYIPPWFIALVLALLLLLGRFWPRRKKQNNVQ